MNIVREMFAFLFECFSSFRDKGWENESYDAFIDYPYVYNPTPLVQKQHSTSQVDASQK